MKPSLESFLRSYTTFSAIELAEIAEAFRQVRVPKQGFLLTKGRICSDLAVVTSGCLRLFYIKDDVDISVWFSMPGESAIEVYSFISGTPSRYFIQAIEDTEVLVLSKPALKILEARFPKVQHMMKQYWEDVLLELIYRFTALQTDTAEQRYLDLMARPELMQRLPLKYLASFIGVTPTSLSRIRRRIAQRNTHP